MKCNKDILQLFFEDIN